MITITASEGHVLLVETKVKDIPETFSHLYFGLPIEKLYDLGCDYQITRLGQELHAHQWHRQ